ncbi:hypothetical protein VTK56DRAFT_3539 [Thermocarpiscus australiensis]
MVTRDELLFTGTTWNVGVTLVKESRTLSPERANASGPRSGVCNEANLSLKRPLGAEGIGDVGPLFFGHHIGKCTSYPHIIP